MKKEGNNMNFLLKGGATDSSGGVRAEDGEEEATAEEQDEQKDQEGEQEEAAAEKEEEEAEEQEEEKQGEEGAEEDSGILSDKERQNEEVNEKDNCSASSISSASSTLEREERGASENGGYIVHKVHLRSSLFCGCSLEACRPLDLFRLRPKGSRSQRRLQQTPQQQTLHAGHAVLPKQETQ